MLECEYRDTHKGDIMCEDYPCCGHEAGDCNGQKYGSDESIKASVFRDEDEWASHRQAEYDEQWG